MNRDMERFTLNPAPRLLVPEGSQRRPPVLPFATAIGLEEVYGTRGTRQMLISELKQLPYASCVLLAAKHAALLEKWGWFDADLQVKLAEGLFDSEVLTRVRTLLRETKPMGKRVLFHAWQLRFLIKASLLYGSPMSSPQVDQSDFLQRYGRCLLIVIDLMVEDRPEGGYEAPEDLRAGVMEVLIRQVSAHRVETPKHLLARYHDLFFRLAPSPTLAASPNAIDLQATFQQATGIDLRVFLATGFGVLSHYVNVQDFGTESFGIRSRRFFRRAAVSRASADRLFSLLGTNRRVARAEHRAKYKRGLGKLFDLVNLMQRPLIQVRKGHFVPASPQDVVERITAGVYWDVHDFLQGAERRKFQRFFGELIEAYVQQSFKRMFPAVPGLVQRAFYDVPYESEHGESRASDVVVFGPEHALFADATVGRLRMTDTVIPGSLREFRQDVGKKIVATAAQIDRSIRDFKAGILRFPGWDPDAVVRFYPIIITASPLPLTLQTLEDVLDSVRAAGVLTEPDLATLEVLSLEDLEFIEPVVASGVPFDQLLIEKNQDPQFRALPAIDFLGRHRTYRDRANNTYLSDLFHEQTEAVRRDLFSDDAESCG